MKTLQVKRNLTALAVIVILLLSFGACKKNKNDDDHMNQVKHATIVLSGAQEVPRNSSTGTGSAHVSYDPAYKTITYDMTWQLGLSTATTVNMHFHGAEAATDTTSSPVTIGITGFPTGNSGYVSGTTRELSDAEANQLLAGKWYLNVHSSTIPGGELRGNIKF